jgi:hypothetical protein
MEEAQKRKSPMEAIEDSYHTDGSQYQDQVWEERCAPSVEDQASAVWASGG